MERDRFNNNPIKGAELFARLPISPNSSTEKVGAIAGKGFRMQFEGDIMPSTIELETPKFNVTRISDGLDFGDGAISLEDRLDGHDNPIDRDTILKVESAIESDKILVPVDKDDNYETIEDDGCGDGRGVKRVFAGTKEFKRSLNRAKVFGAGLTMAVADSIGRGRAFGKRLKQVFKNEMTNLDEHSVEYGAHTADSASGDSSGCGAIDKAPLIISNAVKFMEPIRNTIKQLTQGNYDELKLQTVFNNFSAYAPDVLSDKDYSGKEITNKIEDKQKVVKELEGPHLETHIIINTIKGFTVDQEFIRQVSDGKAQVFAVDAWRLQELAKKLHTTDQDEQDQAYLSMLVYTLATAATLTKGDLPVYVVAEAA